ncbi:flagellar export chaperone FliS [Geothrix sp. 21YS21S-4]|uniref:flagellar export chaperone FliS n=1 Tax=Geothrix sp. 21YS21S-4 TaxID=3068889 RepID=UPI0027BA8E5A|nr:flagellar export chaperone FliS [Geothrix sp. 21YS21S-4]
MKGYTAGKATDHYLLQRIQGASPEQMTALLLEGGQRFIKQAQEAMRQRNLADQARHTNRIADIILELKERLNHEDGGEVVQNLIRIYEWWTNEVFDGAQRDQPERLQRVSIQMGEMRETWEELHRRKTVANTPPPDASPREFTV